MSKSRKGDAMPSQGQSVPASHTLLWTGGPVAGVVLITCFFLGPAFAIANQYNAWVYVCLGISTALLWFVGTTIKLVKERDAAVSDCRRWEICAEQNAASVAELEKTAKDALVTNSVPSNKIGVAKREFARMFHPDSPESNRFSGSEKLIRSELFKEFWAVLEKVERSN